MRSKLDGEAKMGNSKGLDPTWLLLYTPSEALEIDIRPVEFRKLPCSSKNPVTYVMRHCSWVFVYFMYYLESRNLQ